ncbi:MAG: hypothetical protein ACKVY0_09785 [Prosthecobacter sp.]|uniref:hypothetical protein n=1 Tax=Prosthecobacter sp. TaxID=1965333 RepID=UPI00390120E9
MKSSLGLVENLFSKVSGCFNEQSAEALVALRADDKTTAMSEEIADKSREGLLNAEEQRQYQEFAQAVSFVSVLQAKARVYLRELRHSA